MAGKVVKVSVIADTKQFSKAFKNLKNATGLDSLASSARSAAKTMVSVAAGAGAAMGALGVKATLMAADLEQSTGAVEAVFKTAAKQIKSFSVKSATALGITRNEYQELATVIGSQLKNAGTPIDQLAGKTNNLISTGADLAAMYGGTTKEAVEALSSALKGERDPIERYGVTLKQSAIDAKAAALGFTDVSSAQAQAAATLALISEQTADARGAFARETNTLSHQLQVAKAKAGDLAAQFGSYLLPAATKAATLLNKYLWPALDQVASQFATVAHKVALFARHIYDSMRPALTAAAGLFREQILPALREFMQYIGEKAPPALATFRKFITDWGPALAAAALAATGVVKAFQAWQTLTTTIAAVKAAVIALNAAMAANPVVLIVAAIAAAIAALVAAFVYLYQHNEKFRAAVQAAWQQIQALISQFVTWFQSTALPALQAIWQAIQAAAAAAWEFMRTAWETIGQPIANVIIQVFQGLAQHWGEIWEGIKTVLSGAWTSITGTIQGAINIITGVFKLFTAVLRGDWSGAWAAIKQICQGAWNAMRSIISGSIQGIQGLISAGVGAIRGLWSGAWNAVKSTCVSAWNGIKNAITSGINTAVSTIRTLPSRAVSALGSLGSTLYSAGSSLISGFINGIKSKISSVASTLRGLTSKLTSWKGPEDVDKRLLTPAGQYVIDGFIRGLESRYPTVKTSLAALTVSIANTDFAALNIPIQLNALGNSSIGAQTAPNITINVNCLNADYEAGRQIAAALEKFNLLNGARGVAYA